MDKRMRRQIERDCAGFMRLPALVRVVSELLSIAAPTVSALLIGDMADYLLAGNAAGITAQLPYFALSVVIIALVVPLTQLIENLLLTKYGFAYDSFLADRFIRLPLIKAQQMEAGTVMERFEEDSAEYCFCQVFKRSRPPVLIFYLAALICVIIVRGINPLFIGAVMLFSVMPVIWAKLSAGLKARLDRETLEYAEQRKTFEHEVFGSRDFIKSFSLGEWVKHVFRRMFEGYFIKTGKKRVGFTALSSTLGFAFSYGAQILTVVLGALLISKGRLTAGELLGGVLLLPTVSKWIEFVSSLIFELKLEKECRERIALFYADEPEECGLNEAPAETIKLNNVCFRYPDADSDIISAAKYEFRTDSSYALKGPNGSGKTTLINVISGLYSPTEGRTEDISGRPLSIGSLRNTVALQEQNGAIFSGTVFDNLFVEESRAADAESLLMRFGFAKPLDHAVAEGGANLSPGEQKKLLLVRALLRRAPMLVLDEPLNHLDPVGVDALTYELRSRRGGLILASHKKLDGVNVPEENAYTLGGGDPA